MNIDVYKSTKSGSKYISVPEGTDIEKIQLPDSIDQDLLTLSPFKTSLNLEPNNPRVALDQNDVIKQIKNNGYAVHGATMEIKVGHA